MTDVKTLDQILRERANYKLKNKLAKMFRELQDLGNGASTLYFKNNRDEYQQANIGYVLQTLERNMLDVLAPHYQQMEIDSFVSQVDRLQSQLNELKDLQSEY